MSLTDELSEQVIYVYTDEMALDDGALIDIVGLGIAFEGKPINRITGNLFWQERPKYPLNDAQLTEHLDNCGNDEEPLNIDMDALGKAMAGKFAEAAGEGYPRKLPDDI